MLDGRQETIDRVVAKLPGLFIALFLNGPKKCISLPRQIGTASSCQTPQVRKQARVDGRSGAIFGLPFLFSPLPSRHLRLPVAKLALPYPGAAWFSLSPDLSPICTPTLFTQTHEVFH
jgi:hypothetical protein